MSRISPLEPPYPAATEALLRSMTPPQMEPIKLFRTLARNMPMATALQQWGSYELSRRLSLTLRQREIVIDRTCARCGAEYEWGVHLAVFVERAGLTAAEVASLTHGTPDDECWNDPRERLLVRVVDSLHDVSDVDDDLWVELSANFSDVEVLDLVSLCGWYHAISFICRAVRIEPEDHAPRFESVGSGRAAG